MRRYRAVKTELVKSYVDFGAFLADDEPPLTPSLTIYQNDEEMRDTGLYDKHGNKLYALRNFSPIGFITRKA